MGAAPHCIRDSPRWGSSPVGFKTCFLAEYWGLMTVEEALLVDYGTLPHLQEFQR